MESGMEYWRIGALAHWRIETLKHCHIDRKREIGFIGEIGV
jgi:hypothetical protein